MRFNFHVFILLLSISSWSLDNIAAEIKPAPAVKPSVVAAPNPAAVSNPPIKPAIETKEITNTIQDPFSRGILKPPKYGSNLDRSRTSNGRLDDIRSLNDPRYYRVLGIYENEAISISDIIEINVAEKNDASYNAFYITLGNFSDKKAAQQLSKDFISVLSVNLNRKVIIKVSKDTSQDINADVSAQKKTAVKKMQFYEVEYGPFNNPELATATCYFLKSKTDQFPLMCDALKKRLVNQRELTKVTAGSATVGLSQAGLIALKDPLLDFKQKDLADTALTVYEGENLGGENFFVVKINQYGIYLASKFDEAMLIPAVTFPVNISDPVMNSQNGLAGTAPKNTPASPALPKGP